MAVMVIAFASFGAMSLTGQRIAVIVPQPNKAAALYADAINDALGKRVQVVDRDLADHAFRATAIADPFNQLTSDARQIGVVIGTDHFLLIRAATHRRSSFANDHYFEAFAAIYLVSSLTGQLVHFHLESTTAAT
ncbi:hypothetical protein BH24ACI3_BH24ACI3_15200 [soil metagenome]